MGVQPAPIVKWTHTVWIVLPKRRALCYTLITVCDTPQVCTAQVDLSVQLTSRVSVLLCYTSGAQTIAMRGPQQDEPGFTDEIDATIDATVVSIRM